MAKKELLPHQKEIVDEANQLQKRIDKLTDLFKGSVWPTVPIPERILLTSQSRAMLSYIATLRKRIELF